MFILLSLLVVYEKGHKIYSKNRVIVADPFKNMHYDNAICEKYRCMNKFIEIPVEYVQSEDLRTTQQNGRVQFMFYNDRFKEMYTGFAKFR